MTRFDIVLPETLKQWVEDQAQTGRYVDASDYVRDLIRRDREQSLKLEELQSLVDEGLSSGVSDENMKDILVSMRSA